MKHLEGAGGVVTIVDTFEDQDQVHLIEELCAGGDLFDKVQQEVPYTEKKAADMIRNILMSLAKMHQMGVIHRDIKPENFLMDGKGQIKFADFGLSSFFKKGQWFNEHLGSPNYMAPEVCGLKNERGELVTRYNEKADIWSVGVILYILLVRRWRWRQRWCRAAWPCRSKGCSPGTSGNAPRPPLPCRAASRPSGATRSRCTGRSGTSRSTSRRTRGPTSRREPTSSCSRCWSATSR